MPKVSVIIPVYGVEKYIERCARSLFEQTLDDIEYIFVDDCTKDQSIDILQKVLADYPSRQSQTTIVHHEINKGLPAARQTGIKVANGAYIAHCDSDDWVDKDMYRQMYDMAIEKNADLVVCDYFVSNGTKNEKFSGCIHVEKDNFIRDCISMQSTWAVWNKLFKKSLFVDNIAYPVDNMGEDMAITLQILLKIDNIAYVSNPLYYYFTNPKSITQAQSLDSLLIRYHQIKRNADIVVNAYVLSNEYYNYDDELEVIKWNVRKQIWSLVNNYKYRKLWKNTYPELDLSIINNRIISASDKCKYIMTLLYLYPWKHKIF
jgi:glycosyltransferase involved in cell wall biosynthesis